MYVVICVCCVCPAANVFGPEVGNEEVYSGSGCRDIVEAVLGGCNGEEQQGREGKGRGGTGSVTCRIGLQDEAGCMVRAMGSGLQGQTGCGIRLAGSDWLQDHARRSRLAA